jgi:hypothetical protein
MLAVADVIIVIIRRTFIVTAKKTIQVLTEESLDEIGARLEHT